MQMHLLIGSGWEHPWWAPDVLAGLGWALCPADASDFLAAPAPCPEPAGSGHVLSTAELTLHQGILSGSFGSQAVPTGNRTAEDLLQCMEMGAKP